LPTVAHKKCPEMGDHPLMVGDRPPRMGYGMFRA
jgi:hypothetical protein